MNDDQIYRMCRAIEGLGSSIYWGSLVLGCFIFMGLLGNGCMSR